MLNLTYIKPVKNNISLALKEVNHESILCIDIKIKIKTDSTYEHIQKKQITINGLYNL